MNPQRFLWRILAAGILLVVLPAEQELAKSRNVRKGSAPAGSRLLPAAAAKGGVTASSIAAAADSAKAILILQTRNHRLTVFGSNNASRYSVATAEGVALADKLTASELQGRFPELHEILTGVAWAGMEPGLREPR